MENNTTKTWETNPQLKTGLAPWEKAAEKTRALTQLSFESNETDHPSFDCL